MYLLLFLQGKVQGIKAFDFGANENVKQKKETDPKETEARQKKSQAFFNGQKACTLLKDAYELLSSSLGLQVRFIVCPNVFCSVNPLYLILNIACTSGIRCLHFLFLLFL